MARPRGIFHAVNVIIKIAVYKLVAIASNTYSSAVGEKHPTAARRDGLAFFMRGHG